MINSRCFLLSLCITTGLLSACNFKDIKGNQVDDTDTAVDPNQPIAFTTIRDKILEPSCNSCHAAGGMASSINLETYASVKPQCRAIRASTVDSRRMPKGDVLASNLIALLKVWIEQGCPE
jgi:uncharacterized membrane protein